MTNNAIVFYESKTGFTARYANWIAEALGCEAVPWKERGGVSLDAYDTVIFGSGFHAGMIRNIKPFKALTAGMTDKKLVVFTTGASPADSPDVDGALRQNFTDAEWSAYKVFYLQSGLIYEKMNMADKAMMVIFRSMQKKAEGKDSEAYQMVCKSYDASDKAFILPLVEYCKQ